MELMGVELVDDSDVYKPSDDSVLLAQGVAEYAQGKFLEIGCGSGFVSVLAAKKIAVSEVTGVDVNKNAVELSWRNAELNNVEKKCVFLESNLFGAIGGKQFDCIAFNPPYLPTGEEEKVRGELNKAFDGGEDGRSTIGEFLEQFQNFLKPNGVLLTIESSLCNYELTIQKLSEFGFNVEIIGRQKFFFEEIVCIKATKFKQ
ncbi:methyltransferase [Candidatus Micrarchaeota archaeon]|nr:methyltransferase [Candidatus Micrarchaeota archaeon]